jgi:hypothetical protein
MSAAITATAQSSVSKGESVMDNQEFSGLGKGYRGRHRIERGKGDHCRFVGAFSGIPDPG